MNDLCIKISEDFQRFYRGVYEDLSDEPNVDLQSEDVEKLIGIVHSIEIGYLDENYSSKVSAIVIHTALDHILFNGNKRLSLILGYFCCHWFGYSMILMEGNFPRLIKSVVEGVSKTLDQDKKNTMRKNAIKALAKEIEEYSVPHEPMELPDQSLVGTFLRFIRGKI